MAGNTTGVGRTPGLVSCWGTCVLLHTSCSNGYARTVADSACTNAGTAKSAARGFMTRASGSFKSQAERLAETETGKQLRTNLLGPGLSWTKGPQHSQCKRKRWHSTCNKHNRLGQQQKRTAEADVTRLIHPILFVNPISMVVRKKAGKSFSMFSWHGVQLCIHVFQSCLTSLATSRIREKMKL